ncbi:FliH/SctL family protein [Parachitinimonas caeni]|uniref:Flagellar assembly protein FliH n=1 Tax=Parachitinimonas caeni TaxID=3031301 RepID=A0ABT7E142_9NEIS|nr:FliH/SctL family protein [Parachitinimonas caeni]MDK2125125.1 FliH/SctL family protein [Parachitinimonas caeni]
MSNSGVATPEVKPSVDIEALLAKAKSEVRAELQDEVVKAKELARQQGYEEGLTKGRKDALEAEHQQREELASILSGLQDMIDRGLRNMEQEAAVIAYEAVCKIAGSELCTAEGILAFTRQAAARALQGRPISVRVNPQSLQLMRQSERWLEQEEGLIRWTADESLTMGSCMIESEFGSFDARLDAQLERLRDVLVTVRNTQQAST